HKLPVIGIPGTIDNDIFGTMHEGVTIEELPPVVRTQMYQAKAFIGENAMDAADVDALTAFVQKEAAEEADTSREGNLKSLLSPTAWRTLKALTYLQFDDATMNRWSLWKAAQVASYVPSNVQTSATGSIDLALLTQARKMRTDVYGLETVQTSLTALRAAYTPAVLEETLVNYKDPRKVQTQLLATYRRGSETELADLMKSSLPASQRLLLLEKRNRAWVPRIMDHHQKHFPAFIAVGAGHLVGANNLLDLLKKQGFEVKRVSADSLQ
ncbi:MAG TPA: TraB/GumN family protein, partial [Bdellovibrionales bacterium]|nr:TraB/GumN family protein [Bdellovibrionales bacterium]